MIVDSFNNWNLYFAGEPWKIIAEFLTTLSAETPEGEYLLVGNEIYARVISYETKDWHNGVFEAHRNYIDIQTVLSCAEGIAWSPQQKLAINVPYDIDNDVEFYETPHICHSKIEVFPGTFVVLFPHDAHMPQLKVIGMPTKVKKVVVKLPLQLATSSVAKTNN